MLHYHIISLTLLRPMEFSIKFDTVKSGWSIVYIEGSQVISKTDYISFSEDDFVSANSADHDEMHISSGSSLFAIITV